MGCVCKDNLGNVSVGEVISIDSNNNYISSDSALVATIGLNDMVVVTTSDAVLIATKDKVQEVKKIVEELKTQSSSFPSAFCVLSSLGQDLRHRQRHALPGEENHCPAR